MSSPALFAALVAAAILMVGAAALSLIYLYVLRRQSVRLKHRLNPGGMPSEDYESEDGGELLQALAKRGKKIEGAIDTENESGRLLIQAGWRSQRSRMLYYASQLLVPLLLAGVAAFAWIAAPEKIHQKPALLFVFIFLGLTVGALLPRRVLRSVATARVRRIKAEIPLFIHLLVLLFEAGLSTRQAFASLVRDGRGVLPQLGKEFELVLRQLEAGGETNDVLKNLTAAIELDDLGNVLSLLRQVDRYGGEVRDPLLENLKVLEDRRTLDMREMVNLMSGRMTIVMVMFFFPALLIFVAGPAFLSVVRALGSISK